MRHRLTPSRLASVCLLASQLAIPVAAADPDPAAPADPEEAAARKAAAQAIASQPQVPTLRGGTLGIPAPVLAEGIQAMVASDVGNDTDAAHDFDFFAKLGGIGIRGIELDIVAERYRQDIPRVELGAPGALPRMTLTDFASVGFRMRRRFMRPWTMMAVPATSRAVAAREGARESDVETAQQATALFDGRSGLTLSTGVRFFNRSGAVDSVASFSGIAGELSVQYGWQREDGLIPGCVEDRVRKDERKTEHEALVVAQLDLERKQAELRAAMERLDPWDDEDDDAAEVAAMKLVDEMRVLEREVQEKRRAYEAPMAEKASEADKAKAASCKDGRRYGYTLFGSLSGTHLNGSMHADDDMTISFPTFTEARVAIGAELQTTKVVSGSAVLPRIGVYAVASRGRWTNNYTGGAAKEVDSHQLEAALYASGQFLGGFNGLVSFGVLRPYGHDTQWAYVINVVPAIGAKLGGE